MSKYKFLYEMLLKYRKSIFFSAFLLSISAILEGIGMLALIPLLGIIMDDGNREMSSLGQKFLSVIEHLGLEANLGTILLIIVFITLIKAAVYMLSMLQVGFAQMRVMEKMRVELLNVLLEARWSYFVSQSTGGLANSIGVETLRASRVYYSICELFSTSFQAIIYLVTASMLLFKNNIRIEILLISCISLPNIGLIRSVVPIAFSGLIP